MGIVFGKTGVAEPAFEKLLSRQPQDCGKLVVPYELRRYGKRFAIETSYDDDDNNNNMGSAFRKLAGYIGVGGTPQNEMEQSISMTAPVVTTNTTTSQKIAMTAPVVTTAVSNSKKKNVMQFMLPVEYDNVTKQIPKPKHPNDVKIQSIPPAVGVIHSFNGWVKEPKARAKVSELVQQMNQDGMTDLTELYALQNYQLWQYHPPFTIPQLRRNEVWIPLTEEQVKAHLQRYPTSLN